LDSNKDRLAEAKTNIPSPSRLMPQAFNIQSSIQISIDRNMATTTLKHPNAQRHVLDMTAVAARLCGWFPLSYLFDTLSSLVCNPFKNLKERIKPDVGYLPPPKSLHGCNVQRFKIHSAKPVAQRMSQLKEPVGSPVRYSFVCSTQSMLSLSAVVAAFLFSCQFSIALGDFRHAAFEELRTLNCSVIAASEECFEAEVKPCRVIGTNGLTSDIFLLATKYYPKTIQIIPFERASFNLAFDLARLHELIVVLTKADFVSAEIRPSGLLECHATGTCGLAKLRCPAFPAGLFFHPLEKRLVRQVEFFNDSLDALRTNNLPVFATVAKLSDVTLELVRVTVLFEQSVVRLLESYAMVPNASSHRHHAVKPMAFAGLVHSELVTNSHAKSLRIEGKNEK
jgi:hypothetical protein